MEKESLYFFAIIPPDDICQEITAFKTDFARRFNSKAALKVVPHITLKAPFKLPSPAHSSLLEWFLQNPVNSSPFQIEIDNFGAFSNRHNPVIYVQPVMNDSLRSLQTAIISNFSTVYPGIAISDNELKFKPHITIAYRDLSPELFTIAWSEYRLKQYKSAFVVTNFHLLQHDKIRWNIVGTYSIK